MANFNPIEIEKSLRAIDFPATKEEIITKAKENGASRDVLDALNKMTEKEYQKPMDVTKEVSSNS